MVWLADSGVLLRYVLVRDPLCSVVRAALITIRARGNTVSFTSQKMAEFWNVCTRPTSARGGYGFTVEQTQARARIIEQAFLRLPDVDSVYPIWRRLVDGGVLGVQVHDARIVAAMLANSVFHILTFNAPDFARYSGITAVLPQDV